MATQGAVNAVKQCVECKGVIKEVGHQDFATARACSPRCAKALLRKEHPDLCKSETLFFDRSGDK
jgi:hypothetical protein